MIEWNFQRKNGKKHYEVYAHYFYGNGKDEWGMAIGETWAFSKEQAERNISYRCGDDGEREINAGDYIMRYEAKEIS